MAQSVNCLPEELDMHLSRVEITGNQRVFVENHCGVRVYDAQKMWIACKRFDLCVCGVGLEISGLTLRELTVNGTIFAVEMHVRAEG